VVSGSDGRKRLGRRSAPFGRLHRKLELNGVILSSSHAKKLAVYFISTTRGLPQEGREGGEWTIMSLPNLIPLFQMPMSICPNFGHKTTTFAQSYTAICGTFIRGAPLSSYLERALYKLIYR